jgi:dynein heavy chain
VAFLLTDSQIIDERFLVYINDLLASGNIQDLFPQEDVDDIVNSIRSKAKAAGWEDSSDGCYAFFLDQV